jgi:hypothetical protein
MVTDIEGIAIYNDLVFGEYYLCELSSQTGYIQEDRRYKFHISQDDETIQLIVLNMPVAGSIEVFFKDINTGHELYDKHVFSDCVGLSYMDWIKDKGLNDMNIEDYSFVKGDYPSSKVFVEGMLTITYWYEKEAENNNWSGFFIPKTGQKYPKVYYFVGIMCFILVIFIAGISYCVSKKDKNK